MIPHMAVTEVARSALLPPQLSPYVDGERRGKPKKAKDFFCFSVDERYWLRGKDVDSDHAAPPFLKRLVEQDYGAEFNTKARGKQLPPG